MRSPLAIISAVVQLAIQAVTPSTNHTTQVVVAAPPTNHTTDFFFNAPGVTYAPLGEWTTGNMGARSETGGSISVSALTTGIRFNVFCDNVGLLVNGTRAEDMGATVNITNSTSRVTGLPYGWYNFTAVTEGEASFWEARLDPVAVVESTTYNVGGFGYRSPFRPDTNRTLPVNMIGNWSTNLGLTTSTPGSRLIMDVPDNTATLELLSDANCLTGGFAPFRVTVSPPPPHAPATQTFEATLPWADWGALLIGWDLQLLYPVQLSPMTEYSLEIEVLGNETSWGDAVTFCIDEVRAYESPIVESTVENSLMVAPPVAISLRDRPEA